jgi:hypothetical protein
MRLTSPSLVSVLAVCGGLKLSLAIPAGTLGKGGGHNSAAGGQESTQRGGNGSNQRGLASAAESGEVDHSEKLEHDGTQVPTTTLELIDTASKDPGVDSLAASLTTECILAIQGRVPRQTKMVYRNTYTLEPNEYYVSLQDMSYISMEQVVEQAVTKGPCKMHPVCRVTGTYAYDPNCNREECSAVPTYIQSCTRKNWQDSFNLDAYTLAKPGSIDVNPLVLVTEYDAAPIVETGAETATSDHELSDCVGCPWRTFKDALDSKSSDFCEVEQVFGKQLLDGLDESEGVHSFKEHIVGVSADQDDVMKQLVVLTNLGDDKPLKRVLRRKLEETLTELRAGPNGLCGGSLNGVTITKDVSIGHYSLPYNGYHGYHEAILSITQRFDANVFKQVFDIDYAGTTITKLDGDKFDAFDNTELYYVTEYLNYIALQGYSSKGLLSVSSTGSDSRCAVERKQCPESVEPTTPLTTEVCETIVEFPNITRNIGCPWRTLDDALAIKASDFCNNDQLFGIRLLPDGVATSSFKEHLIEVASDRLTRDVMAQFKQLTKLGSDKAWEHLMKNLFDAMKLVFFAKEPLCGGDLDRLTVTKDVSLGIYKMSDNKLGYHEAILSITKFPTDSHPVFNIDYAGTTITKLDNDQYEDLDDLRKHYFQEYLNYRAIQGYRPIRPDGTHFSCVFSKFYRKTLKSSR